MKSYAVVILTTAGLLAACSSQPMKPSYIASLSSWELCVADAAGMLYGSGVVLDGRKVTPDAITAERERRGESCQPSDRYVTIAQARIQKEQQDAALQMQRNANLSQALQGFSQTLQNQQAIEAQQQANVIQAQQTAILQQAVTQPAKVEVVCRAYDTQMHCMN